MLEGMEALYNSVIEPLEKSGFEAYAVGGCVRDSLLLKKPSDFDVTTNALPDEIKSVFSDCVTIDTGIKHGTVTVISKDCTAEVTTYRCDGDYTDLRHPATVTFSKKLSDDLSRRDFTVNALAYNKNTGIVDKFGGKDDLNAKIIRCVGDADKRFNEDALRILRAVRFSSALGFEIEDKTSVAIHKNKDLLDFVSAERIFSEIKKLVFGKSAESVIKNYRDIICKVFPLLESVPLNEYEISAKMTAMAENKFLKLASLLYFLKSDDAKNQLRRLKADNETIYKVSRILKADTGKNISDKASIRRALCACGADVYIDALNLKLYYYSALKNDSENSRISALKEKAEQIIKNGDCIKISDLAVNGTDVANAYGLSGAEIGDKLKKLLFAVMDGKIPNERNALLNFRG